MIYTLTMIVVLYSREQRGELPIIRFETYDWYMKVISLLKE